MIMQYEAFFLGMLMLNIFFQHDHAQHEATLSSVGQVTDGVGAAKKK